MGTLREDLEAWLASGGDRIGEIAIRPLATGMGYRLTHWEDADSGDPLERFTRPEEARSIAIRDDAGGYRPLKTAPNLRHGWCLELGNIDDLQLALDFFYPAALGVHAAFVEGRLEVVPLRATLGRQSGMYAVTRNVSDEGADAVIGTTCCSRTGCLKKILWELEPGRPPKVDQSPVAGNSFPLLCNEACNLLVAALRKAVKNT